MQKLVTSIIPTWGNSLYSWRKYVDDVFSIAKIIDINLIMRALNNYNPNISFTYELIEKILDALITVKSDFSLGFLLIVKQRTQTAT